MAMDWSPLRASVPTSGAGLTRRLGSPGMVEHGTYMSSSCSVGFLTEMVAVGLQVSVPENKGEAVGCFMTRSPIVQFLTCR